MRRWCELHPWVCVSPCARICGQLYAPTYFITARVFDAIRSEVPGRTPRVLRPASALTSFVRLRSRAGGDCLLVVLFLPPYRTHERAFLQTGQNVRYLRYLRIKERAHVVAVEGQRALRVQRRRCVVVKAPTRDADREERA